jgi:hypothetical protein
MLGTLTYDEGNRILSVQPPINLSNIFSLAAQR